LLSYNLFTSHFESRQLWISPVRRPSWQCTVIGISFFDGIQRCAFYRDLCRRNWQLVMNDEQVGFNLADLRKLCKSYIDYTRTYMDRKEVRRISRQRSSLDNFVFQFSSEVVDFSSQYGSDISISYTASNVTGRPSKFPNYGDFPQSYVMVSYRWSNVLVHVRLLFTTRSD